MPSSASPSRALTAERAEHQRAADLYRDRGDAATAAAMQVRADTVARFLPTTGPR